MKYLCCFLFLCVLMLMGYCACSQQFGGNPASVKWKQINTDTVRVIFPEGLDTVAQRITSVTHRLQREYSGSIGNRVTKVSIILQKDVTVSNAFVQLAPARSEFYMMPPQNAFELGAQSWADNLALHEYRHIQQNSNFKVGLSRTASFLFGQGGQALANNAAIPNWFYEGDAVYNETMLSEQGRGRLPNFFNGYKSLYYDNRKYSFAQLRNGSLKKYVPGHYELGYLLVAYGREKYGDDFWRKVAQDAAAFKSLFYPMQSAVKKNAAISYDDFTRDALDFYNNQWEKSRSNSDVEWLTAVQKNNVVNYLYPYRATDDTLIVLKNSYGDIPAFYKISPDKKEIKITVRDIAVDDYFSYNNGIIIYAAYEPDLRWGNRNYSVIKMLDAGTGASKKITGHSKYFSPDIAHRSDKILAVAFTPEQKSLLCLLDAEGNLIRSFENKQGHYYSYPKFSADDSFLYVIDRNEQGEMAIFKQAIEGGNLEVVLPFGNRIIGFPAVQGDTLTYTSSNNGYDEIWAYVQNQNQHYRLASYQTGLYQATFSKDGRITASTFTSDGYRLAKFETQWLPAHNTDTLTSLYVKHPFMKKANVFLLSVPATQHDVTKYRKLFKPINFHTWSPWLSPPDYSFRILGENVLNTVQSELYYTYNTNERYHRAGYTAIYGGTFLQPFFDINQTWNRNAALNEDTTLYWNEFKAAPGLRLPLTFTGGRQYRNLTLSASYNINKIDWKSDTKKLLNDLDYIATTISYSGQVQKAVKQIYPHWAQSFLMQYRASVTSITAQQLLISGSLYVPGLSKNHSFVINAAWQARDTAGEYVYTNNFPISRGYEDINFPRMYKLGFNYHFSFLYPDWGFGGIVFFNRLRANIFYDYTNLKSLRTGINYQFKSTGTEIYFDTKWWNQQPITFGVRYSRLLDYELVGASANRWELILPVTLF